MHWEAFLVIGGLALALGAVLLVPSLLWARRARKNPEALGARKVGKAEFAATAVVVALLLGASSARFWAEGTSFGQWMATDAGTLTFLAAVLAGILMLQLLLKLAIGCLRARAKPK